MLMFKAMARPTKGNTVRHLISQFWIRSKRLDMVRMQIYGMSVSAVQVAMLAGIVIAFKDSLAPVSIFYLATGYIVLVGLVNMILPSRCLPSPKTFTGIWMHNLGASCRAYLPEPAALTILWHRLLAHWARNHLFHALGAHLIEGIKVVCAGMAHLAGYAYTPSVGFQASGARNTCGIFDGLTQCGYCCHLLTAFAARYKCGTVARIANTVVSAIHSTLDAPVLCHAAIIPQLPDLERIK